MAALGPERVSPETCTALPRPTVFVAKAPVAPVRSSATTSPTITPSRSADSVTKLATVVPSYSRLWAAIWVTVRLFAVMPAVAAGGVMV